MLDFLSVFREVKYTTTGFLGAFGRNEEQRIILGSLDKKLISHFIPQNWHYIMIGVAKK
jgi:hypothetical protein